MRHKNERRVLDRNKSNRLQSSDYTGKGSGTQEWHRIDDWEHLAFPVRSEFGEIDYRNNDPDLDERLVNILNNSDSILDVTTDFEMN